MTVAETGPTLTIDLVDGNNVINHTEALAGVALTGTVSGIAAGSTFNVTVTDNGVIKTYVATVNTAGTSWSATIPASDATALANGTATVSAQVSDANGNQATASQTVTVAETGPTLTIDLVDGNNVINHTEALAGVALTGTVSGIAAGSTFNVTVTDNGVIKTYVATVNTAGTSWSATIPASDATALANGTATVSAQVSDANGNQATASQTVTVAETGPTLTIDLVDGNNVINHTEALAGVALTGTVSGIAAGSTFNVTVTDNGVIKTYVATVNTAGTSWSATIPASDATALANGTATVSAQVSDANGNQATASQTVTVAETGPTLTIDLVDGNNVINHTERFGRRGAHRHGERDCRGQHLQRHGHRQWRDQDLCRHRQHGGHQLERDDPGQRCHRTRQRHRDGFGAGQRCQRQPGHGEPDRDGGRDRPDADDRSGRRQQRHQSYRGFGRRGASPAR